LDIGHHAVTGNLMKADGLALKAKQELSFPPWNPDVTNPNRIQRSEFPLVMSERKVPIGFHVRQHESGLPKHCRTLAQL
jgi:hypothetical protein